MKIDLQELKRLYADDVFQEPDNLRVTVTGAQLQALVDVVARAQAVAEEGLRAKRQFGCISHAPVDALRAALTPFDGVHQ